MNQDRDDEIRERLRRAEYDSAQRSTESGEVFRLDVPPSRGVRLTLPLLKARAVYVLLVINIVMYAVTVLLSVAAGNAVGFMSADPRVLYLLGAKFGPAIDAGEYWRFLTPIVLHGGLIHLGFNTYALYLLGPESERIYGTGRFLAIYLIAGLAGTVASYMRSPNLSIGASGAIFGLIGALAAFFYSAQTLLGREMARQQMTQLITMAAINLFLGLSVPAIDNAAHIGGFVAGGLAGFALAPRFRVDDRLYPPVVVRAEHTGTVWALAGLILLAIVSLATFAVARA
jgi:rhomboid protease GluP